MRTSRSCRLFAVALAALTIGACGSSAKPSSSPVPPTPLKLSLSASGDEAKAAMYPQRATTYVLDGTLADLGAQATVHKLVGHAVTDADVTRLATALGLHAAAQRTEAGYEVRDGDALLTVDTSGGTTYVMYSASGNSGPDTSPGSVGSGSVGTGGGSSSSAGATPTPDVAVDRPVDLPLPIEEPPIDKPPIDAPMPTIPPAVDVPNADDATAIAQSLLDQLGVLDGRQWSHDVSDTDAGVVVSCPPDVDCPAPPPSEITQRTVNYEMLLDGKQVPGVGWSVTVGSHRRVESLSGTWADLADGGKYALRSSQGVFGDLKDGRAQYVGVQAMTATGAAETGDAVAPEPAIGKPAPGNTTVDTIPPLVVHVTGVTLGAARWDGTDGGRAVSYLVPTYRFKAVVAEDPPYDIEVLALDPSSFSVVNPPATDTPMPAPAPSPATDIPAPK